MRAGSGQQGLGKDFSKSKAAALSLQNSVLALALWALLFAFCSPAAAQPAKIPRIGYVSGTGSASDQGPYVEALRQGLRELGYIEGKNFLIEFRGAEGKGPDRMPGLATELVQAKVDILVLPTSSTALAAKQATKTIPIIMVLTVDPVVEGFVDSLAHPGGNITGVTRIVRELSGKRLELIKELDPAITRVGLLWDANSVGFKDYEAAARDLKIQLQSLGVRSPNRDLEGAFQTAAKARVSALITLRNAMIIDNRKRIAELAIQHRLPSMSEGRVFVEAGTLMSYSSDENDSFRRAAYYVDKILKGAKPADLPVEQPTKFEFVINLKPPNKSA
jgi:putative tryptophan/tyrosine transport system substrate-binding protein